jgi:tRNA(Arg) A34 adenosine deaminase TadA
MKAPLHSSSALLTRRSALLAPVLCGCFGQYALAEPLDSGILWIKAAEEMKQLALSWGDQAYGAVLVKNDRIIGYGPSRVVKNKDPDAHAEREAIKHATAQVGAQEVQGAILYSTSRPCSACELAAAKAGVHRMYFGRQVQDAGRPGGG